MDHMLDSGSRREVGTVYINLWYIIWEEVGVVVLMSVCGDQNQGGLCLLVAVLNIGNMLDVNQILLSPTGKRRIYQCLVAQLQMQVHYLVVLMVDFSLTIRLKTPFPTIGTKCSFHIAMVHLSVEVLTSLWLQIKRMILFILEGKIFWMLCTIHC